MSGSRYVTAALTEPGSYLPDHDVGAPFTLNSLDEICFCQLVGGEDRGIACPMLTKDEPFHFFEIDDFTGVSAVELTDFADNILGMYHFVVWVYALVTVGHFEDGGGITEGNEEIDRRTREFVVIEPSLKE